jgi:hypothetical protein
MPPQLVRSNRFFFQKRAMLRRLSRLNGTHKRWSIKHTSTTLNEMNQCHFFFSVSLSLPDWSAAPADGSLFTPSVVVAIIGALFVVAIFVFLK